MSAQVFLGCKKLDAFARAQVAPLAPPQADPDDMPAACAELDAYFAWLEMDDMWNLRDGTTWAGGGSR